MKYDLTFNPAYITFLSFIRIMFETNEIANLLVFLGGFLSKIIFRKILDIMLSVYDIQKFSRYCQLIYRKFCDIVTHGNRYTEKLFS